MKKGAQIARQCDGPSCNPGVTPGRLHWLHCRLVAATHTYTPPPPTTPHAQLLPSVAKRVRDPSGVALEIQALEAAALAKIGAGTKVIVMDEKVSLAWAGLRA